MLRFKNNVKAKLSILRFPVKEVCVSQNVLFDNLLCSIRRESNQLLGIYDFQLSNSNLNLGKAKF